MTKKFLGLVLGFVMLFGFSAMAEEMGSGCGLGKSLFAGSSGVVAHVLAATTNGSSGNQTSGITSGTSGCDADSVILNEKEQEVFVSVNIDNLSQDMAQGSGNYLNSLASLMGCSTGVYADFASMTQEKYAELFNSDSTSTMDLLTGLKRELNADSKLSASCTRIS